MTAPYRHLRKFWDYGVGRTALAAFCAHSASISIGICQGYSAILIPQLNSSYDIDINSEESSWLASLGAITNPIGSILSGLLAEYYGRKKSIQISSIPFLIGWLCIAFANNTEWLYAGRLISGIAAGMASACYTYVSEISTPEHRGIFQALGPICASFGILLTYTLGYFINWATIALISVAFSMFTLISIHFLPESPAYLLKIGDNSAAFDSYLFFRRNNALAQQEIEKHTDTKNIDGTTLSTKEVYLSPQTVKPFLILVTLFFLQELSGIYSILFYAVNFFEETGLNIDNYISSIFVAAIRFIVAIVTAFLINKYGRKILCMTSSAGMSLTMLMLVVFFKYYELYPQEVRILPMLPLVCVIFNVMFSMLGMLPIPWILVGELFPLEVRSIMSGVVICLAQCFIFICVKVYPDMIFYLNFSGTLMTFLAASVVAFLFCKFNLPETRNKSLQEIESYFQGNSRNRNSDNSDFNSSYDNRGFVVGPEKSSEIFKVQVC